MHDDLPPLLKNLPPATASALMAAITKCGTELGIGRDWVERWLAFTVVADALASYAPDGTPAFEIKGGAAVEMRLRQFNRDRKIASGDTAPGMPTFSPRATKDLDATYRGEFNKLEEAVRAALAQPRHHFAFRVERETETAQHMHRFRVRVSYQSERFGRTQEHPLTSVQLETSAYEGEHRPPDLVPAFSLKPFGLEGPSHLPCLPLSKQIAQKLHAVTEPPAPGRKNDRFRDLLDIILLSTLEPASPTLRTVCEETFHVRARHGWPPKIVTYPEWIQPMQQRASEMGLDQTSADEIVDYVSKYVSAISTAGND